MGKVSNTKANTTKATPAKAVAGTKKSAVFVVQFLNHIDDYKRAESEAGIAGVYDNEVDALKKCIVENILKNEYDEIGSDALQKLLDKAFPDHEGPLSDFSEKEMKGVISNLPLAKLKTIDSELNRSMAEIQPEYTMQPSMTTFSVHKKPVLSKGDASDNEEN